MILIKKITIKKLKLINTKKTKGDRNHLGLDININQDNKPKVHVKKYCICYFQLKKKKHF